MFTGIVEEVGYINSIKSSGMSAKLNIRANKVLDGTKIGDSISTGGVCLTVSKLFKDSFDADVMIETMKRTNFSNLTLGSKVNLERAMKNNGRFGGHIVSGHIDGVGVIESYKKEENATWITISVGSDILRYIVEKGSVCIDGVSLTVAYVDEKSFKVSIIPHTGEETTLISDKYQKQVNIECDVIGKYVEKLLGFNKEQEVRKNINKDFLRSNGFL